MTRCFRRLPAPLRGLLGAWGIFTVAALGADYPPKNYAVQATAEAGENPARIALSWVRDGNETGYRIARKSGGEAWQAVADLSGGAAGWTDGNVSAGKIYEYQIRKSTGAGYTGTGYVAAGLRVPYPDARGTIVLMVENSIAGALETELARLGQDLAGEGWTVVRRGAGLNDSPASVRATIQEVYRADPENVEAVLLFGHVPVAYSGNIAPDGHENHRGAWPADTYFGDMDGTWTDTTVNTVSAEREINRNVPGDGKFDPSVVPSEIELMVGRVDLRNMTCFANKAVPRSETDLLRQYLNKNHAYRHGRMNVARRAVICDNFSDKGDDPIGGSAWRNFPGTVGPGNIVAAPWDGFLPEVTRNSYLWAFASGGGSYYYSSGVATSDEFAEQEVQAVFTMFMGSYFGDWNNESNFLRAALGSGNVLTASYSGFPQTLYFPMGIGETIGYCIRLTQNNLTNTVYGPWDQGQGEVHVALMGDPTLRLYPVKPAEDLRLVSAPGSATLSWTPSPDSGIEGYHIYRGSSPAGPFTRVSAGLVADTSFADAPGAGQFTYLVRAVKLERSPSGTFYNPSQGIFGSVSVPEGPPAGNPALKLDFIRSGANHGMLRVSGEPGQRFEVESSENCANWSDVTEGALVTSTSEIAVATGSGTRFFRALNLP